MMSEKEESTQLLKKYMDTMLKANETADLATMRAELNRMKSGGGDDTIRNTNPKSQQGNTKSSSNLQRLCNEREQLLLQGYDTNDPLVLQIDSVIKQIEQDPH